MERRALLIHGAFGGPWTVQPLADALEKRGWQCHAPPLRHHGGDPGDADALVGVSIADYCSDLAAFVASLPSKPVILGHSMGGVIAQKLAMEGLASGVVLLNGSVISGILPVTAAERSIGTGFMRAGAIWEQVIHPDMETLSRLGFNTLSPETQAATFARLSPESGQALFELFFWIFDDRQTTKIDVERVTCPILVVSGAEDHGVSPAIARQIAARYGEQAELHIAEGCCHYLMQDARFPEVAAVIADWMEQL
ncbi:MAG: alpha/beta hydrolase [Pseudomonadota bacterium]